MATETVTIPRALADQLAAALQCASETTLALAHLSDAQPQDEVMVGVLCTLRALSGQLDQSLGLLTLEFNAAIEAGKEAAHA